MVDAIFPSISSAIERSFADLDALLAREAARKAADFDRLQRTVANINVATPLGPISSGPDEQPRWAEQARGPLARAPEPEPYVPLPQRTTHGGPFGPVVRRKLIAEALGQ